MSTKLIMTFSVICYALGGLTLLFLPDEAFAQYGVSLSPGLMIVAQLFGAAMISLATMNWIARATQLGGIYGRSLVVGNFCYAFMACRDYSIKSFKLSCHNHFAKISLCIVRFCFSYLVMAYPRLTRAKCLREEAPPKIGMAFEKEIELWGKSLWVYSLRVL